MLSKDTATIRQAHISEAGAIAGMSRLHIEYGLRWRWTPNKVKRSIRDRETVVLVATIDGVIVGFAIMKFGDVEAHLHLLAVDPRQRRKGIGRAMLAWLEKSCDTAAMHEIRLELRASNKDAREFYRSLGYHSTGVIPDYYDRREAALVFGKRLIA